MEEPDDRGAARVLHLHYSRSGGALGRENRRDCFDTTRHLRCTFGFNATSDRELGWSYETALASAQVAVTSPRRFSTTQHLRRVAYSETV